jgi:hypothetical protein
MPLIFFLVLTLSAFAQTSYVAGTGIVTGSGTRTDLKLYGRVELTKDSRTWYLIQCPPDNKCVAFKTVLIHDVDGKFYLETPVDPDRIRRSQAKVDEDQIKLHRFETSWETDKGIVHGTMTHLTVNGSTLWKEKEWTKKGVLYESKVTLNPVSKEEYDAKTKGLSITVIQTANRQRPKK